MWKWLGGCLIVCVVLIAVALWTGYQRLSSFGSGDGTETVAIHAPVGRVFASLANGDSLTTWMAEGTGVKIGHHGILVPGDTLQVRMSNRFSFGNRPLKWTVSDVTPNQRLALQLRSDTTNRLIARRQFNLATVGDSTMVMGAVTAPFLDSLRASRGDTVKASDVYVDVTAKTLVSAMRMQSHIELQRLKARVEGRASAERAPAP